MWSLHSRTSMLAAGSCLAALAAGGSFAMPARASPSPTHAEPVPILMYHVVAAPYPGAPHPDLYVSRQDFAAQVGWLAAHGDHAVTLQQVYDHWYGGSPLPARPVILSFDDGYRSDFTNALPVLRAHGWPGVLDLQVDFLRRPRWGLEPWMVRDLLAAGWELDSHTLTHPDLTGLETARLDEEIAGSREALRRQFHVPVNFFCYPYGRYDARVVQEVRAAGYLGATTTDYGLARPDDPYTLARVRVDAGDGAAGLASKLAALGEGGRRRAAGRGRPQARSTVPA